MSGRRDFLNQQAPENYVAGLGRGATGFTTRSDLGPAREGPSEDQIKAALQKRAEQLGAQPSAYGLPEKKDDQENDDDERFQDPENETGLFASGDFTREDDEADQIYQMVDEKMSKRRQTQRFVLSPPSPPTIWVSATSGLYLECLEAQFANVRPLRTSRETREAQEKADYEAKNPKIQQQFADLKRSLSSLTEEEWAALPEPGDLTRRNKRARTQAHQRFYAVPDSVIAGARDSSQFDTSVQDDGMTNGNGANSSDIDGTTTDFRTIGAARNRVLNSRLDRAEQSGTDTSSGTATNVDPKGYLTSLAKSELKGDGVEVGDINRVRDLLASVIKTNPKHAPGFIAAARLEELAGKLVAACKMVEQGCKISPHSEDLWVESIRLQEARTGDKHNAKVVAAEALKANPDSVRLWQSAMSLEIDRNSRKRVARKAIDRLPKSVALWKSLVNEEESPEEAKLLLSRAVEEIPLAVELHLALARLCAGPDAMKVLNKARALNPSSHEVWLAAVRLQESMGQPLDKIRAVMNRAVKSLANAQAMLKREEWIDESEKLEDDGMVLSATACIQETLSYGLDEDDDDLKKVFNADAQASLTKGKYATARAIYAYTLRLFPQSKSTWLAAIDLEKNHGTRDEMWKLLDKAVEACPDAEQIWQLNAKSRWDAGFPDDARRILAKAFNQLSSSENIFLSAVKLEADANQIEEARQLLATARREAGTDRVWYKSVAFERQYPSKSSSNSSEALQLVIEGLNLYPKQPRLHMQKGQIYQSLNQIPQARQAYNVGTHACPHSVPLYLLLSRLEESQNLTVKARSVLERGLLATKSAAIALEQVKIEFRANNIQQAKNIMAKALQTHGTSGPLWSFNIWHLEPRTQRKPRSLEAIKKVDNDSVLFVTVARVFWGERKTEKAQNWFEKAILLDADLGDTWAWYFKFLGQYGTEEKKREVLEKCRVNEPRHGELWQSVVKDPRNAGMGVEEVLGKVVGMLE